jgi:hypothetical protein
VKFVERPTLAISEAEELTHRKSKRPIEAFVCIALFCDII